MYTVSSFFLVFVQSDALCVVEHYLRSLVSLVEDSEGLPLMNEILHAKVLQLEKQLTMYTEVVQQQQQALHDVFHVLDTAARGGQTLSARDVASLQQRVGSALRAAAASGSSDDAQHRAERSSRGGWSPEKAQRVHDALQEFQSHCTDSSTGVSAVALDEMSKGVARRILETVRRLMCIWLEHMQKKVERLLEEPREKFQLFHNSPGEDTLTGFMDSFVDSSDQIVALLEAASAECASTTDGKAPQRKTALTGNPFAVSVDEDRLVALFAGTIGDAFKGCVHHGSAEGSAHPDKSEVHRDSNGGTREADPPSLLRTQLPAREAPLTPPPPKAQPSQQQQDVGSRRSKPPPPLPLSSDGRVAQSRSGDVARQLPPPPPSSGTPSGCVTPRASRQANDSSQIWSAMGLNCDARLPSRRNDNADPASRVSGESEKLRQLNDVLRQLEFQLAGVALSGRNTGSEAKYYALTKKLQKVRAEVVKEQREQDELRAAEAEKMRLWEMKEEHRRMFRR